MQNFERRRDRFTFFNGMDNPALNLCFTLELPDFRPWCKREGLPPFHVMLCAVLRAVMRVENFRYRVHEGEVIRIERLVPSFTVVNPHGDLNFVQFDWSDDVREFVARSLAARDEVAGMTGFNQKYLALSPREYKDKVFVTCIPWLDFTSLQHPVAARAEADMPSLAWGRFRDGPGPGRLILPFSVQAHHGFVDGYHVHLLGQRIADELDTIIA